MIGVRVSDAVPGNKPIGKTHRKVESKYVRVSTCAEDYRSTEVMKMKGSEGEPNNKKLVRPSED